MEAEDVFGDAQRSEEEASGTEEGSETGSEQEEEGENETPTQTETTIDLGVKDESESITEEDKEFGKKDFKITVGEHQKHGDGRNAYTTYKINIKTGLVQYKSADFVCERRYNDFYWLYDKLSESFRGIIIPPLPDKTLMQNRFDVRFIEKRRNELQRFLKRIIQHPVLATSDILKLFLESTPEELEKEKNKKPNTASEKASKVFGFLATTVTQSVFPAEEVEVWFEQKKNYLLKLETELTKLLTITRTLNGQYKETGKAHYDVSQASAQMGSYEKEFDEVLANDWLKYSDINDKIRLLLTEVTTEPSEIFEETLEDWIRLIGAAKKTLQNRFTDLGNYQNAEKQLTLKKERKDKAQGNKVAQAQKEVDDAEKKVEDTKTEFETISETVRKEIGHFENSKGKEMRKAMRAYVQANMNVAVQVADQWKQLINHIETTKK